MIGVASALSALGASFVIRKVVGVEILSIVKSREVAVSQRSVLITDTLKSRQPL